MRVRIDVSRVHMITSAGGGAGRRRWRPDRGGHRDSARDGAGLDFKSFLVIVLAGRNYPGALLGGLLLGSSSSWPRVSHHPAFRGGGLSAPVVVLCSGPAGS